MPGESCKDVKKLKNLPTTIFLQERFPKTLTVNSQNYLKILHQKLIRNSLKSQSKTRDFSVLQYVIHMKKSIPRVSY